MSNDTLTLICLLKGESFDHVFDVEISTRDLVSRLKRLIKKERKVALKPVDAADLILWSVTIPDGDQTALQVVELNLEENQQGIRKLSPMDIVGRVFPNSLPTKHIHVIVRLILLTNAGRLRLRVQRHNNSPVDHSAYELLFRRISEASPALSTDYSDPHKVLTLPFPFRGHNLPSERFPLNPAHTFEYMGRENFTKVSEAVRSLQPGQTSIYICGTLGYGKSYILAALVCLLFRQQKRVVYLPDCRALAKNFVPYARSALLLAHSGDPSSQNVIAACKTVEDLVEFCEKPVSDDAEHLRLYFIIDQYNALDQKPAKGDGLSDSEKVVTSRALDRMTAEHYRIRSASASYQSALYMEEKQTNEIKISLYGGLSEAEMMQWWDQFGSRMPIPQVQSKLFLKVPSGVTTRK